MTADEMGETALTCSPQLKNAGRRATDCHFGAVPSEAPRSHASLERECIEPQILKLFGCNLAHSPSAANRHYRNIRRQIQTRQGIWVLRFQCLIGIHVNAPGDR